LRLVLDTNVVLKALIKDSVVRGMLLRSPHEFVIPQYAIEETKKHLDVVASKSGLSEKEINSILDALLVRVKVIPAAKVASKMKEAEAVMSSIDAGDVPFVAACMSAGCDGIWSDDKNLKRQHEVRVWTTKEVAGLGRA
jgi:predicted nucleic acid-binding protein